jgi:hypothetical protein
MDLIIIPRVFVYLGGGTISILGPFCGLGRRSI